MELISTQPAAPPEPSEKKLLKQAVSAYKTWHMVQISFTVLMLLGGLLLPGFQIYENYVENRPLLTLDDSPFINSGLVLAMGYAGLYIMMARQFDRAAKRPTAVSPAEYRLFLYWFNRTQHEVWEETKPIWGFVLLIMLSLCGVVFLIVSTNLSVSWGLTMVISVLGLFFGGWAAFAWSIRRARGKSEAWYMERFGKTQA